ncbi:MAG TPA: hypothetical protein VK043_12960 [Burkholderiales bacterium]|nr:hypothetical protein [Burkholderiales bacterium]
MGGLDRAFFGEPAGAHAALASHGALCFGAAPGELSAERLGGIQCAGALHAPRHLLQLCVAEAAERGPDVPRQPEIAPTTDAQIARTDPVIALKEGEDSASGEAKPSADGRAG